MKKNQRIGGIGLLIFAAVLFLFAETDVPVSIPISLIVVGIALIAASRRRDNRRQA